MEPSLEYVGGVGAEPGLFKALAGTCGLYAISQGGRALQAKIAALEAEDVAEVKVIEAEIANLQAICEEHLQGRYHIELVDLLVHPQLSRDDQIVAIPTLVRKWPPPMRKIIGDLSDTEKTLVGLQLKAAGRKSSGRD